MPDSGHASAPKRREVIFEFTRVGNAMRVTAMDCASLTEVAIVGAPGAGEEMLKRTALNKLDYVMGRQGKSR